MKIIKTKLCRKIVLPVVYLFALQPSFAQVSSGGLNKTSASKVQLPLNKIQQKAPSPPPTNAGLFKEQSPSFKQPSILKYQGAYQDGSILKKTFTVMKLVSVKSLNNEKGSIEGIKPRILNEKTESENVNGKVQYCTSKTQTLSADNLQEFSTTFGQNNLIANIYPGALYHFEDYYNGKWAPVPFARNAMALTTSVKNLTGKSYENVSNPSRGTLTNAVAKLFSRHSDNEGEVGYEGFTYNMYKVESAAELDFALNTGGHYLMASASNQFASQERSYHKYLVIDGYKKNV